MKTRIFIIIVCCILGTRLNKAQEIFPTSDAIWNVQHFVNSSLLNEWIYGLSGDTIINDTTYQKLYLLNDSTLNIDSEDIYLGGFRQEDKKVWFRLGIVNEDESFDEEFLLYDFSKNIGDTIVHNDQYSIVTAAGEKHYNIGCSKKKWISIVRGIEETPNGRIYIVGGSQTPEYWIEGVGNTTSLLGSRLNLPTDGNNYSLKLACFKHNGEIKYLNNDLCNKCFCITNFSNTTKEVQIEGLSVTMDDGNICQIQANQLMLPLKFNLFDTKGQIVYSQVINSEYTEINFEKRYIGMFFFSISNRNIVKTGKISLQ